MSIVDFKSSTWTDPWLRKIPTKAKLLFIYLWTNDHRNLTGLYSIDIETISFETGLTDEDIREGFTLLFPKVRYDGVKEVVWVVNQVRHQFMRTNTISPKIITGIEKALLSVNKHPLVADFLNEYSDLGIVYPYPIDTVSIYPPSGGEGAGKGGGKGNDEEKPF